LPVWVCGCSLLSNVLQEYSEFTAGLIKNYLSLGGVALLLFSIGAFQVKNFGWKFMTKDALVSAVEDSRKTAFEEEIKHG